jgi:hypothetical protein
MCGDRHAQVKYQHLQSLVRDAQQKRCVHTIGVVGDYARILEAGYMQREVPEEPVFGDLELPEHEISSVGHGSSVPDHLDP